MRGELSLLSAVVLLSWILLFFPASGGGRSSSSDSSTWKILTKRNFSSEIRSNPHILLLVTVPWSGESRSLMKQILHLVSDQQEQFGYLKLRVIYRNSEKMLADVLGASEGITLLFYHYSSSYKYHGRIRAQNIMYSVNQFMPLQMKDVPLKSLYTKDDLENFFRSTDKAVLLVEFCGWSAELLHRKKIESNESLLSLQKNSDNAGILGGLTKEADMKLAFSKNQKGLGNKELTCEVKNDLPSTPWLGEFSWSNQSDSHATENRNVGTGEYCTLEEFHRFESFFSKFIKIAKENYLPLERQRFGLISERSLLPFLGVGTPKTSLLMLQFSGCDNCSIEFQEGDDLKTFLQMSNHLVMELDVDGKNSEPAFPVNRPSIILFVDRSSNSSRIRRESKSSLEVLRKFAQHTSKLTGHRATNVFTASKLAKVKDKKSIMIIKKGESISLENTATVPQGNDIYDILARLLQQKNNAFKTKQTKVSLLAKEVGFQLLSDDFDVRVIDSLPSEKENGLFDEVLNSAVKGLDQTSEFSTGPTEQGLTDGNDGKQPEFVDTGTVLQKKQELMLHSSRITTNTPDDKIFRQEESRLYTCQAENQNSFHSEESPMVKEYIKEEHIDQSYCSSNIKNHGLSFFGSIFFSDGGYQFLKPLTSGSKIPSMVILDPIMEQHYVFSEETNISYSSLYHFVENFLNGSLTPYQQSAPLTISSRETPRPPFVNLDFHEADPVPRVTANNFCELVLGVKLKHCEIRNGLSDSDLQNIGSAWKMDVLVLLSTTWCGYCLQMELAVREVYRAFKSFMYMEGQLKNMYPVHTQDTYDDTLMNMLPSIFLMDCTLNGCGSFLKQIGKKEVYPTLLLFPAENKSAISYEGDVSVANIIEFLATHASNSQYLSRHEGFLWTRDSNKSDSDGDASYESSFLIDERALPNVVDDKYTEFHSSNSQQAAVGSILTATDKLLGAHPFDNATILIVVAGVNLGFRGVIINKPISWDVFGENPELDPLVGAPLYNGGPVRERDSPVVSLARKPTEGYDEVVEGLYFGSSGATNLRIQRILSSHESWDDYWFFLGYSSWDWTQLFDEFAEGAWNLFGSPYEHLKWPDNADELQPAELVG